MAACATFAAQAAADASVVDVRHRVHLERVGDAFSVSEGQPDSRMQEWSPEQVSSSTPKRVRTTRAPAEQPREYRADAALALELALALGDDHLRAPARRW